MSPNLSIEFNLKWTIKASPKSFNLFAYLSFIFNDAVCSLHYITSNDSELEDTQKEATVA